MFETINQCYKFITVIQISRYYMILMVVSVSDVIVIWYFICLENIIITIICLQLCHVNVYKGNFVKIIFHA